MLPLVWRAITISRPSVVGRCTSIICTVANFSKTARGVRPAQLGFVVAGVGALNRTDAEETSRQGRKGRKVKTGGGAFYQPKLRSPSGGLFSVRIFPVSLRPWRTLREAL